MATTVSMPQLGESVAEGTIGKLLKGPGDRVERDEALVEVMTDKVNTEIPSPVAGIVEQVVVREGDTVPIGAPLLVIGDGSATTATATSGASATASAGGGATASAGTGATPTATASPALVAEVAASAPAASHESARSLIGEADDDTPTGANGAPKRASPFVRSLARKYGIDLDQVAGTGLGGRVSKDDILAFIEQRGAEPVAERPAEPVAGAVAPPAAPASPASPAAPPAPTPPPAPAPPVAASPPPPAPASAPAPPPAPAPAAAVATAAGSPSQALGPDEELVPLTPMRRAIAEHMVRSLQTSPHAWGMVEIDVSKLVALRASHLDAWQAREGFELTFLPFFVKAVVEALRENRTLNARWSDRGVVLKKRIHIGIAVAVKDGLLVPVVKDADQKNIAGLALAIRDLVVRARAGRIGMDDLTGGTFTVNNTGVLGSIASGPIINQPQAGIITMEAIVKRPVVTDDDAIAIRAMMNACLSFDHRIADGAEALRFLQNVKRNMEGIGPTTSIY